MGGDMRGFEGAVGGMVLEMGLEEGSLVGGFFAFTIKGISEG